MIKLENFLKTDEKEITLKDILDTINKRIDSLDKKIDSLESRMEDFGKKCNRSTAHIKTELSTLKSIYMEYQKPISNAIPTVSLGFSTIEEMSQFIPRPDFYR